MKVTKIIPKTIPILILLREKHKIWCKIGQKTLYLVVLGGYAYTLGGGYFLHRRIVADWQGQALFASSLLWAVSLPAKQLLTVL